MERAAFRELRPRTVDAEHEARRRAIAERGLNRAARSRDVVDAREVGGQVTDALSVPGADLHLERSSRRREIMIERARRMNRFVSVAEE